MEDSKKLNLLKFKWKPEENFKFPSRNSRRYNPRWECDFPWLRYSKSEDSVYCGYCLVFAKSGCFSTSGYIDWKNAVGDKRGNFKKHEQCKQHQDAQQQATEFLSVCDSKERKDVYSFLSTAYKEKIERNRKILLSIVDVIVTLGKRNIGLRGSWDKVKKKEDGNFLLSTGKPSLIKTSNTISKKEQGMHSIFPSRLRMSLLRVAKQK